MSFASPIESRTRNELRHPPALATGCLATHRLVTHRLATHCLAAHCLVATLGRTNAPV